MKNKKQQQQKHLYITYSDTLQFQMIKLFLNKYKIYLQINKINNNKKDT